MYRSQKYPIFIFVTDSFVSSVFNSALDWMFDDILHYLESYLNPSHCWFTIIGNVLVKLTGRWEKKKKWPTVLGASSIQKLKISYI